MFQAEDEESGEALQQQQAHPEQGSVPTLDDKQQLPPKDLAALAAVVERMIETAQGLAGRPGSGKAARSSKGLYDGVLS